MPNQNTPSPPTGGYFAPKPAALTMSALAATFLCAAGVMAMADTYPSIVGIARVVDGDTLRIGKTKIRLNGIDAPELRGRDRSVGIAARQGLIDIIAGGVLVCRPDGTTTHDRIVAVCSRKSDDVDIAGALIGRGLALDCAHFSGGRYAHLETEHARRNQRRAPYC